MSFLMGSNLAEAGKSVKNEKHSNFPFSSGSPILFVPAINYRQTGLFIVIIDPAKVNFKMIRNRDR